MAKYRIPTNLTSAYDSISLLDAETISLLVEELEMIRVGATTDELIETLINKQIISIPDIDLKSVIEAVFSIYGLINRENEENIESIISNLVESFIENKEDKEKFDKNKLESNLLQLIRKDSRLELTHKTFDLLSEYDKIYTESRIITDIRLIFNDDLRKSEQAAIVIHQLKVVYHESGDVKNLFFALDSNDLEELKKHIERAIEKEKFIKNDTYKNMSFISLKR